MENERRAPYTTCCTNCPRYLKMNKSCMQFKNNLILIGLVFIMSIFMNMSDSIAAIPDKTLTYCFEVSPTGFDANQSETIPAHTASAASLYNRLIEFGRGGTKLEPGLAESWTFQRTEKSTHSIYGAACNFTVRPGSSQRVNSTRRMCSLLLSGCAIRICRSVKRTRRNLQIFIAPALTRSFLKLRR